MNSFLHVILVAGSLMFFVYIINIIRFNKIDLKYALIWIAASCSFLILSFFPGILKAIAGCVHIVDQVTALYMIVIFFLMIITFTTTIAASKNAKRVQSLHRTLEALKVELEELKDF